LQGSLASPRRWIAPAPGTSVTRPRSRESSRCLAVLGPISGIVGLHIGAVLIEWTGEWIGGRGDRAHIRAALAWGAVPSVWSLIPWVMVLLLVRGDTFTTETPFLDAHPGLALLALVPFLTIVIIAVWQPFVVCKAIGEVQGFSAWRALGNIVLASLVVGVPLLVVALVMVFALR
jgi:Yip1-like protein